MSSGVANILLFAINEKGEDCRTKVLIDVKGDMIKGGTIFLGFFLSYLFVLVIVLSYHFELQSYILLAILIKEVEDCL